MNKKGGAIYNGDSFFTLDGTHQIGLILLSFSLCASWLWIAHRGTRRLPKPLVRLGVGSLLFYAFVWGSPQLYYTYYRLIIPDLPAQWVIGWPPNLWHLIQLMSFSGPATLSAHGQGFLGWGLVLVSISRRHLKIKQ